MFLYSFYGRAGVDPPGPDSHAIKLPAKTTFLLFFLLLGEPKLHKVEISYWERQTR